MVDGGDFEWSEGKIGFGDGGLDGSVAYALPEKVLAHLADALNRQKLLDAEIGKPGNEAQAVLHGSLHAFRPWGVHLVSRSGAYFELDNMFGEILQSVLRVEFPAACGE